MAREQQDYITPILSEFNTKIRDLEEKQRIMKDRLFLIGQNLIEIREKNNEDILEVKKDLEILKMDIKRIKDFLDSSLSELSKFAKKSEMEILAKQAKMFQPLELARISDVESMIRKATKGSTK